MRFRWWMLPMGGAVTSAAIALLLAREWGFPLDDSWIHQDFARTLVTSGQFALQPGQGGAGSTAPLWVLLLTLPYLLAGGQAPIWLVVGWAILLGTASLAGLALVTSQLATDLSRRTGARPKVAALAGAIAALAVVSEWHLVWAGVSGMETDLFALLGMLLILGAGRGMRPLVLGLLAGTLVAVRPEGILLALLIGAGAAWSAIGRSAKEGVFAERAAGAAWRARPQAYWTASGPRMASWARRWLMPYAAGALTIVLPYLVFNLAISGRVLPSTFYAKNATYSAQAESVAGMTAYFESVATILLAHTPVLPVLCFLSYSQWLLARRVWTTVGTAQIAYVSANAPAPSRKSLHGAERSFPLLAVVWLWPLALVLGFLGHTTSMEMFHGRYLMPGLPAFVALGAAGVAPLFLTGRQKLLPLVAGGALVALSGISSVRAGQLYASDVHLINRTQVATALWLRANTPPRALVASHDIGALAYFSGHRIQDTEGLADPGIDPYLGNQPAIVAYLKRRHVAYVVMYADWFPPPAVLMHDLAGHQVFRVPTGSGFLVFRTGW